MDIFSDIFYYVFYILQDTSSIRIDLTTEPSMMAVSLTI
jgi:hypothetical protein